jgi:hypothetical protein
VQGMWEKLRFIVRYEAGDDGPKIMVSLWRCYMLVSDVQPDAPQVMILRHCFELTVVVRD